MPVDNRAAAIEYSQLGWYVIPVDRHTGYPIIKFSESPAPTESWLDELYSNSTRFNVAVRTGDSFDVLDIDDESIAPPVDDPTVKTPHGVHVYMKCLGLTSRRLPAEGPKFGDWKGYHGYVIVPPSISHKDKITPYEWLVDFHDLKLPQPATALIGMLTKMRREEFRPEPFDGFEYQRLALQQEKLSKRLYVCRNTEVGTRNEMFYWCCCEFFRDYVNGIWQAGEFDPMMERFVRLVYDHHLDSANPMTEYELYRSADSAMSMVLGQVGWL